MSHQRLPIGIFESDSPALYYFDRLDIEREKEAQRRYKKKLYSSIPSTLPLKKFIKTSVEDKIYKYDYANRNGVNVSITGSFEDVVLTKAILEQTNPQKVNVEEAKQMMDRHTIKILADPNVSNKFKQKQIGVQYNKDHAILESDSILYSGSGSLLIFNFPEGTYLALFRSSETKQYDDLGGKIDSKINFKQDLNDILFENAKKETLEESAKLFLLENRTKNYVDINSDKSNSIYRSYIYHLKPEQELTTRNMKIAFQKKLQDVYADLSSKPDYKETDDIEFFDLYHFEEELKDFNPNVSHAVLPTITGRLVRVRGRVLRVLHRFLNRPEQLVKLYNVKLEDNQIKI